MEMAFESIFLGCFIYYGTSRYLRFRAERQRSTSRHHEYPIATTGALVRRWELRHSWAFFKISYTMSLNWLVGLLEEEYYIRKGNIWAGVEWYDRAVWNYERALRANEDSWVRAHMGWCYGQLGMSQAALEHYRRAYERNKHPRIAIGLAFNECAAGNLQESRVLIQQLRGRKNRLDPATTEQLERIESMVSDRMRRTEEDNKA